MPCVFQFLCQQVQEKYERKHPHSEWRYELRVRYLPQNLTDLYEKDRVTFYYYYDQVSVSVFIYLFICVCVCVCARAHM
jgi:hypothetical protein